MARTWSAVLARLGVPTGDGRIIDPAGGSSRNLPLPLAWQQKSEDGHGGSQVVARIETLRIADGMVTATGSMLESAPWEVIEQLEAGVIGPSVDLDDIEYVMDADERIVMTKWRIAGATLVSIPAFADVSLTLDPLPAEPVTVPEPSDDYSPLYEDGRRRDLDWEPFSLRAAADEQLPPADWFQRPDVDQLTPLVVTDTGRVFGHIAGWDTCHVGLPGCVTPPSSPTGYTYFHVAEQRTSDGATLPVGTLVAGPRHADAQLAFRAAQEHYDDPSAAVARVVAGEDEHGIWVAGWLLPGATPEALDVFRSSPVSGDWRRVGGSLELIGVCSVNTPGFPVRRVHFAAGYQRALIGSFGITPQQGDHFMATHKVIFPEPGKRQVSEVEQARARWAWAEATTKTEA